MPSPAFTVPAPLTAFAAGQTVDPKDLRSPVAGP